MKNKYETIIRGKWIYGDAQTFDEMILALETEISILKEMKEAGCKVNSDAAQDDYFFVTAKTKAIAEKFGMNLKENE